MKINSLIFTIFTMFFTNSTLVNAMDIEWLYGSISIEGEIKPRDSERLIQVIKHFDRMPKSISINSNGGDVFESIKIGKIIKEMMAPVFSGKICASSCFFILMGSPDRSVGGKLGIHRPYFDRLFFSSLSASQAEKKYAELQGKVTQYLLEVGVPRDFIDRMYTISSKDILWINDDEFYKLIGQKAPYFEELSISKCGMGFSDKDYEVMFSLEVGSPARQALQKQYKKHMVCERNLAVNERKAFSKKHNLKHTNPEKSDKYIHVLVNFKNDKVQIIEKPGKYK